MEAVTEKFQELKGFPAVQVTEEDVLEGLEQYAGDELVEKRNKVKVEEPSPEPEPEALEEEPTEDSRETGLPKRNNSASERIRALIAERKEKEAENARLKYEIETIKMQSVKQPVIKEPEQVQYNRAELENLLKKGDMDSIFKVIESVSEAKTRQNLNTFVKEISPFFQDIALDRQARKDNIDDSKINAIYAEFPELKNIQSGYDIAKKMVLTSEKGKANPKSAQTPGKSAAAMQTGSNKPLSQKEIEDKIKAHLKSMIT